MSRFDPGPERESSRTVVVVLLSLIILAVIGAVLGYVIGRRDIDGDELRADDAQSPTAAATSRAAPEPCPSFIQDGVRAARRTAALPVRLELYIRTDKREAWICREDDGIGLWYQGHDKSKNFFAGGEIPTPGVNGLLVSTVTRSADGTGFTATNGGTTYRVSRQELKVTGGQNFTERVVEFAPPA